MMNPISTMTGKALDGQMELMVACAAMLEPYVEKMQTATSNLKLNDADMKAWKEKFYPSLVESGPQLPDNLYFEPTGKKKNYGIGTDGEFSAKELFQFLFRLYKCMYELKAATA